MVLSDSDSDSSSSCSDDSSVEGYDLKPKFDPNVGKKTGLSPARSTDTYDMTVSDSDDDSSSEEEDSDEESSSSDNASALSEITMGTFMTAHSRDSTDDAKIPGSIKRTVSVNRGKRRPDRPAAPVRSKSLDLTAADEAIRLAEENTRRLRETMDASIHSCRSSEEIIQSMAKALEDDFESTMDNIDAADLSKMKMDDNHSASDSMHSVRTAESRASKASIAIEKRRKEKMERLERIRNRIKDKEWQKENDDYKKKADEMRKKFEGPKFDMSEKARLERIYGWYTRSGMPPKDEFIQKVSLMPPSAGVSEEDVELLPWSKNGKWINAAKVTSIIYRSN